MNLDTVATGCVQCNATIEILITPAFFGKKFDCILLHLLIVDEVRPAFNRNGKAAGNIVGILAAHLFNALVQQLATQLGNYFETGRSVAPSGQQAIAQKSASPPQYLVIIVHWHQERLRVRSGLSTSHHTKPPAATPAITAAPATP